MVFKAYPSFGDSKRTHDYAGNVYPKNSDYVKLMSHMDFVKSGVELAQAYVDEAAHKEMLDFLSRKLWQAMGELSLGRIGKQVADPVVEQDVKRIEQWMAAMEVPAAFVRFTKLPAVHLNDVRTRWRMCEPSVIEYGEKSPIRNDIYSFMNRASDLLFLMAYQYERKA